MSDPGKNMHGWLIERILSKKSGAGEMPEPALIYEKKRHTPVPDAFTRFDRHPGYEQMLVPKAAARRFGIDNPFFRVHEACAGARTYIGEREFINFSSYNYLGLVGHPLVNKAAVEAIERYGTSPSASRLVAGERPVHRELEKSLADLYGVDDCVVFVSGHATNVSTIGYLFGPKDLVLHDSLIHNSVLEGARLCGAARRSFPHNDLHSLEGLLSEIRHQFERVLIVVEGLYSMDGDFPDLPRLVEIKQRFKAFLMVDEAHSLGVMGNSGRGISEHFAVPGKDVDIWMGTLSKALSGCGGFIAGTRALVENLKYAAPGFVYSVGMSPPLAAASLQSLRILIQEPERVASLKDNTRIFLDEMRSAGIDTGLAEGYALVPLIVGSSVKAVKLSNQLFAHGINVLPIIHPAVEEKAARLRFFFSSAHTQEDIRSACIIIKKLMGV